MSIMEENNHLNVYRLVKGTKPVEKNKKSLPDYMFFDHSINIGSVLKMIEKDLDITKLYYIEVLEAEGSEAGVDWRFIYSYTVEHLKRSKFGVIPVVWPSHLMFIVPIRIINDRFKLDPAWPQFVDKYQEVVENRFNINVSKGIGKIYPILALEKSFQEACIALTLNNLMGKRSFSQKFSELGVFSPIFSQDIESIKDYCFQILGRLMEYDEKSNGELLSTLRILLDSNFNWKNSADALFVHINTLYYRVEKIENLLQVKLSQMDTRVNLFTAIKVWDTLKFLEGSDYHPWH